MNPEELILNEYFHFRTEAIDHYSDHHWAESRAASLIAALHWAELVAYRRTYEG